MTYTDFASLTADVARHLWGDPNTRMSSQKELRWGSGGSRSVDVENGLWYDHEAGEGEGGGVIDLVRREIKCEKADAVQWLVDHGFLADKRSDDGHSARQDRPHDERRAQATQAPETPSSTQPDRLDGKWVDVKGYTYTDADGTKLYQVLRRHWQLPDGTFLVDPKTGSVKKTFLQRRPDGNGGWVYNLEGIGHRLYQLPKVLQAIKDGVTVFVVEGEKDVETLEKLGLVATTNSGGVSNWTAVHAEPLRGADVVILVDNDEPGRKGGEKRARSLRGIAAQVRVLDFSRYVHDFPAKNDVTDWVEKFGGTSDKLIGLVNGLDEWRPAPPVSKMGAIRLDQIHSPFLRHEFAIDGFLDRRGVAIMPGASASGKTFVTLDMGMSMACGLKFMGMDTLSGLVVYQAGEGKEGVTKRLDGWMQEHGIEPSPSIPFVMLTAKVNLFRDDKDVDTLIEECREWSEYHEKPVRMVVIDTFNKAITGANENAGQDMTKVLSRLERISETLDCAVLVPMHMSKAGDIRGHTSIRGDVSNVILITKTELNDANGRAIRTIKLDKNKDGEGDKPMRFVLRQVATEVVDGKPVTTCVIDKPNGDEEATLKDGRLSSNQIVYLETLKRCLDSHGETAPDSLKVVPHLNRVVPYKTFAEMLWSRWPFTAPEHEIEGRKREFTRAVADTGKKLSAYGYVDRDNDLKIIWWTGKTDRPKRRVERPLPVETKELGEAPF